ncbi:hypothetical protein SLS62_001318 [Diatrype stigma]|uniref:SnoaL-like domain-containing protein n=1 Tax=Diatrype stigma TaxID=117547 RepID=A0AAN9YW08_9PEZI
MASHTQPTAETLLATANAYFAIFTSLDPAAALAIMSEQYTHTMAPDSVGLAGPAAPMDRARFAAHLGGLRGVLRSFPVTAREAWPNPSLRQVVVWADSRTEWHEHIVAGEGKEEWEFRGEYIFALFMDETGEKVERAVEFLDSKATGALMGLFERAAKRKAELEGEGKP